MCPDASHEITVPAKKSARGSLMGGRRSGAEDSNRVANAKPSKICDAAIENKIKISDPQVR